MNVSKRNDICLTHLSNDAFELTFSRGQDIWEVPLRGAFIEWFLASLRWSHIVWKYLCPCSLLNMRNFPKVTFTIKKKKKKLFSHFSVLSAFVINVTSRKLNLSVTCVLFLCSHFSAPSVLCGIFHACDTCCQKCQRRDGVWYLENQMALCNRNMSTSVNICS